MQFTAIIMRNRAALSCFFFLPVDCQIAHTATLVERPGDIMRLDGEDLPHFDMANCVSEHISVYRAVSPKEFTESSIRFLGDRCAT